MKKIPQRDSVLKMYQIFYQCSITNNTDMNECKYLTIILRNRAYRLYRKIEQDNCFVIQQIANESQTKSIEMF